MLQKRSLIMWSGIYPTNVKDITILVKEEKLPLVGKVWIWIRRITTTNQTLSWSASGSNLSSVELKFISKSDLVMALMASTVEIVLQSNIRQSYWSE